MLFCTNKDQLGINKLMVQTIEQWFSKHKNMKKLIDVNLIKHSKDLAESIQQMNVLNDNYTILFPRPSCRMRKRYTCSKLTATGSTAAHIVPNSRAADTLNSTWLFGPVSTPPTFLRPNSVSPAYTRNKITHSHHQLIATDGFVWL